MDARPGGMRRKMLGKGGGRPGARGDEVSNTAPADLGPDGSITHTSLPSTPRSSAVSAGGKSKPGALPVQTRIANTNATYQMGAELGRGGFGAVFQALNVDTGDFVAIKRIELNDVENDNLSSIELEIDLLKKLNHANIVKYIDSIRTEHHLHIVLEFMENGSLAGVCKRFGNFTEPLCAIYMTQVLCGLEYLHEQGVLHRDIKGANILTTKDGQVKLADFGVALKLSDKQTSELDVVGSPFWMAPEIIEMNAPTSACDIWSVGCTIIELISGKPPYYDLAAMAALFRIVQDDFPPMPETCSEALRDFLLQCFKKEPLLRKSAAELLRHPWLKITSKQVDKVSQQLQAPSGSGTTSTHTPPPARTGPLPRPPSVRVTVDTLTRTQRGMDMEGDDDAGESVVNTIRLYKQKAAATTEESDGDATPPKGSGGGRNQSFGSDDVDMTGFDEEPVEKESTRKPGQWRTLLKDMVMGGGAPQARPPQPPPSSSQSQGRIPTARSATQGGEEEDWDSEILSAVDKEKDKKDKPVVLKLPGSAASSPRAGAAGNKGGSGGLVAVPAPTLAGDDDMDELIIDDDDDEPPKRVVNSSLKAGKAGAADNRTRARPELGKPPSGGQGGSELGGGGTAQSALDRYKEQEEDDDDLGDFEGVQEGPLQQKPMSSSGATDVVHDDMMFDDSDFHNQPDRGAQQRRTTELLKLMEQIKPDTKDKAIRESCSKLFELLDQHPDQPANFVALHGVLPIMHMLELRSLTAMPSVLAVINRFNANFPKAQEGLALIGFIPTIIKFASASGSSGPSALDASSSGPVSSASPSHTGGFLSVFHAPAHRRLDSSSTPSAGDTPRGFNAVRLEASKCVHQICTSSKLCLQMFIGCGGLPVLVDLVASAEDASRSVEAKKLALIGIDCINKILQDVRRTDVLRILAKLGLLQHLSVFFSIMLNSLSWPKHLQNEAACEKSVFLGETWANIEKVSRVFLEFSKADITVKAQVAHDSVLQALMRVCKPEPPELLDLPPYANLVVTILKVLRNIAFQEDPLNRLDAAGGISVLMPLMDRRGCVMAFEMEAQIMPVIYYLCLVNNKRQEKAARAGIVPILLRLYEENSHLKVLALGVLCDLAHTSDASREQLWRNEGVVTFLKLLTDWYWQVPAVGAISVWLTNDIKRVESSLIQPANIEALVGLISNINNEQKFEQISQPFLDMLAKSAALRKALGASGHFVSALVGQLQNPKAIIRKPVLYILRNIYQAVDKKAEFIKQYALVPIMRPLASDHSQVLVKDLATQLLHDFERHVKR